MDKIEIDRDDEETTNQLSKECQQLEEREIRTANELGIEAYI
jgi:hypothetical protein